MEWCWITYRWTAGGRGQRGREGGEGAAASSCLTLTHTRRGISHTNLVFHSVIPVAARSSENITPVWGSVRWCSIAWLISCLPICKADTHNKRVWGGCWCVFVCVFCSLCSPPLMTSKGEVVFLCHLVVCFEFTISWWESLSVNSIIKWLQHEFSLAIYCSVIQIQSLSSTEYLIDLFTISQVGERKW